MLTDEEKQAIIDRYHTDKNYDLWDAFDAIERAVMKKLGEQTAVGFVFHDEDAKGCKIKAGLDILGETKVKAGDNLYAHPLPAQAVPSPIDTAPDDGEFLALSNDGEWLKVHNQRDVFKTGDRIVCHGMSGRFWAATHWMPLSAASKP